jgi:hypothetical protein
MAVPAEYCRQPRLAALTHVCYCQPSAASDDLDVTRVVDRGDLAQQLGSAFGDAVRGYVTFHTELDPSVIVGLERDIPNISMCRVSRQPGCSPANW